MSEKPVEKNDAFSSDEPKPNHGRKKKKIRIKYRERVKITKRPKGYKIKRFWKKNKKNLIAVIILFSLLGITLFMAVRLLKHEIEMNKLQKDLQMQIPD